MVYLFWFLFSFHHHCQSLSICKRSTLEKICPAPSPPVSTGPNYQIERGFASNYFIFFENLVLRTSYKQLI